MPRFQLQCRMQRNAFVPADDRSTAAPGSTLLILFGGVLLGALDIAIVGPALPAIQSQFQLDARQLAAIFSVYILFGLISAPILASLSDRWGRRRVYTACIVVFGIGSLLVATASSLDIMLVGRAVQAFGAGGTLPVASAVIADTFPRERRGRALGLIGAVFGLAFVIGPVLGGLLLPLSWRWLFAINLPLVVILASGAWLVLEDRKAAQARGFDWPGVALLAVGLSALAWGAGRLGAGNGPGGIDWELATAWLVAALALLAFLRVERGADSPIVHPRLLHSRQMRIVGVLALATGLVEASMVFLPTLAVTALGVSPSRASFMLMPLIGALIVGSVAAGRLLDRIGAKPVIQAGMSCTIAGLSVYALLPLEGPTFYAGGLLIGLGLSSLLGAPLRFVALEEGGESERGASQGLITVCVSTGRLFGASVTGGIAAAAGAALAGYREAMLLIMTGCGIALIASCWLRPRRAD
jgi:MFS family permease